MKIDILIKNVPDKEWDNRLLNNKFGTIHQTKEYAEFRKKLWGQEIHYITFVNNEEIIGQMTLFEFSRVGRKINKKFGNTIYKKLKKITRKFKTMYTWYYGPIIFNEKFADRKNFPLEKRP